MQKWADYLISAVRYTEDNFGITHFKVHKDFGTGMSEGATWTREEVITALSKGKTFVSVFRNNNGGWHKGKEVFLIPANGDYIFTNDNKESVEALRDVNEY